MAHGDQQRFVFLCRYASKGLNFDWISDSHNINEELYNIMFSAFESALKSWMSFLAMFLLNSSFIFFK